MTTALCCGSSNTEDAEITSHEASVAEEMKPVLSNAVNTTLLGVQSVNLRKSLHTGRRSGTRSAKAPAREDTEKPHACGVCGCRFRNRRDLDHHGRIHSGVKPNECTDCGRQFTTVSQLRSHRRTHTQEAAYSCSSCGEKFVWLNSLKRHQRVHQDTDNTNVGELRCDVCSESFDSRQQLDSHNLLVHGIVGNSSVPDVDQSADESRPVRKKKATKRRRQVYCKFLCSGIFYNVGALRVFLFFSGMFIEPVQLISTQRSS